MNIIETAVTGLAFGAGTIVGVVAGMVVTIPFLKKEREDDRKKRDEYNAETVRLLKIRASSSDLIAAAIAEDTQHDKLVRAAVTGLCTNPGLVMARPAEGPDGTKKCEVELADDNICWAARRIATVVAARECAEQRKLSRELDETLADYQKKQGIKHAEWWKEEQAIKHAAESVERVIDNTDRKRAQDLVDKSDLTDTGEKK